MEKEFLELQEECGKLGISLSDRQLEQFHLFYELLIEKNKVMNLTAITQLQDVVTKHFLDSLSLVRAVFPAPAMRVMDMGTGAGFPGIPLKIAFPETEFTLVDSLNKRIRFLQEVIGQCSLKGITAVHGRAEDLATDPLYREQFDLCVSRAVAPLPSLCEYCLPFVKVGGSFISYKSTNVDIELTESKRAIPTLGGRLEKKIAFSLADGEMERNLLIIKKERITPKKYPRKAGTPKKDPL